MLIEEFMPFGGGISTQYCICVSPHCVRLQLVPYSARSCEHLVGALNVPEYMCIRFLFAKSLQCLAFFVWVVGFDKGCGMAMAIPTGTVLCTARA